MDDWEQREFSDIFAEVKSGLSRMLSNDDIGLPVVRANNINDGQLNLVDDIKYWYKNDPQGANTNNYLIEQGDILINFINSEAKMGTAAYVTRRPERDTIYTTNILRCKVNDEYNPYFIYSLTFLNSYKNYIASITKPAVNQASFTTVDFKKYSIKIPTVKEQNQIADLIETFNKLITLHQRKIEKLKLAKKALLQKLFPKNGSQFPEIRFKDFTDAWEQRKLGECVDISTGYPFDSQDFNENGEYLVITNGNIQENTPFVLNNVGNRIDLDDSLKKYILDIDDLLITMDGTVGRVAIVVDNKLVLAQRVCRIKSNEPYYIYQVLSKNDFIQSMNKIGHGGTIKHISLSEISEYQAYYPKSQKERIKISNVLTNCDKLITLHQRKLDKLQDVKKGLLQKMFV